MCVFKISDVQIYISNLIIDYKDEPEEMNEYDLLKESVEIIGTS